MMTDTPAHIKQLQLKIWLDKKAEQRLIQYLTDNDALYKELLKIKTIKDKNNKKPV